MNNEMQKPIENPGILIPGELTDSGHRIEVGLFMVAAVSRGVGSLVPGSAELRGHLPDPIDIPNHIANAALTVGLLTLFARGLNGKEPRAESPEMAEKLRRVNMIAFGSFAVAANGFAEVVGYGKTSTADPYDFAYGLLGGALAYRWLRPNYLSPDTVAHVKMNYPEDSETRKFVTAIIPDPIQKPQRPANQPRPARRSNSKAHHNSRGKKRRS